MLLQLTTMTLASYTDYDDQDINKNEINKFLLRCKSFELFY